MTPATSARRTGVAAAAAFAAAALVLASAAPAMAAGRTVADGDQMFIIDCAGSEVLEPQLYSVDSATAATTPVGDGTPTVGDGCAMQAAYDATTGTSYFVEQRDIDGFFQSLFIMDTVTGQSTAVDEFQEGAVDIDIRSIAIGIDGAAYAISQTNVLYSLDLASAEVTEIAVVAATGPLFSFAADPTTGVFYVSTNDDLATIDVATGILTPVYELEFVGSGTTNSVSMQVDSGGVLWFINGPDASRELWSASATVADTEMLSGEFIVGPIDLFTNSLLIIPSKKVAATGLAFDPALLIGAGSLVLLGGALVLMRRRASA